MKKNIFIVILIVIVLGLTSFIVYDKTIKKDDNKETKNENKSQKEIDVNSDLVKDLVYPTIHSNFKDSVINYVLTTENIKNYSMKDKILAASSNVEVVKGYCKYSTVDDEVKLTDFTSDESVSKNDHSYNICNSFDGNLIESNFKKMFGPDTEYIAQTLTYKGTKGGCFLPSSYDKENNKYYAYSACGGAFTAPKYLSKTYKAVQTNNYLYIYDYAIIEWIDLWTEGRGYYVFKDDKEYNNFVTANYNNSVVDESNMYSTEEEIKSSFDEMIAKKEAKTYIWTFKKQSDGKYYFDSGKWED